MSFYYAQINEENICYGVSELATEINHEKIISVAELDISLLGKIWNGSEWLNPPPPENPSNEN